MIVDNRLEIGHEMLVFMKSSVNVGPKSCAIFLSAMDRTKAIRQPCIEPQLVLPHVKAFSSNPLVWIANEIIWVIVLALLLLLLSSGPILLLCVCAW